MSENTAIAWTHHTFNPWWGCEKVAPECANCYAEAFDRRTGGVHWGPGAPRRTFGEKHWAEPLRWNERSEKTRQRHRVFCASMADVFQTRNDPMRDRLWVLIRATPHLDWLLLTKRPENIVAALPCLWGEGWPNVWLGTSVGHPDSVERARVLADVPCAVRFISCEPLIGPVILGVDILASLDWMIVGGESGPKRRPMDMEWMRALHVQAQAAGIYWFAKQDSAPRPGMRGAIPDDLWRQEFPR